MTLTMASVAFPTLLVTFFVPVLSLILRDVYLVVPFILYEIDRPAAGVIFMTVFAPFFCMAGRDMEVDGFLMHMGGWRLNDSWFGVDYLGLRVIGDVDVSVKAGLADCDGYANVGGLSGGCGNNDGDDNQNAFHIWAPFL